jgi:hypothetical protein
MGMPRVSLGTIKSYLLRACRQFGWADLRWAHLWILGSIAVAALINAVLPNGWTIWPLVPAVAAMVIVNEEADRSGEGVPPFQVYGFVLLVFAVYALGVLILSKVPLLIQVLGLCVLAWYSIDGWIKQRQRARVIEIRRQEGRCIHCGQVVDPYDTFCPECGLEPDPGRTEQQRLAAIVQHGRGGQDGHARQVLKQESYAASASRKERELLARADQRRGRIRKR